jgi:hypothetical protein
MLLLLLLLLLLEVHDVGSPPALATRARQPWRSTASITVPCA